MVLPPLPAQSSGDTSKPHARATARTSHKKTRGSASRSTASRSSRAARVAHTARLRQAFVASTELRPMAQQLATLRTPAAYAGVSHYAHAHTGEVAAAAYLALGHAYLLDKRFAEADANLRLARQSGEELADYADYFAAESNHEVGNETTAETFLRGFSTRYPESIFNARAPELESNVLLGIGDLAGAQRVLAAAAGGPAAGRPAYELAEAQVAAAQGQSQQAQQLFKHLLLGHPLTAEAQIARARLTAMGAESSLAPTELRSLGDAYYNAGHYEEAAEQYRALARISGLDAQSRHSFAVAEAACDLKLKRLTLPEAEALADTPDDNGARRLYLLMELARNRNDLVEQQELVSRLESSYPRSQWLAEALFSSGNMYMLRHDYPKAVEYYGALAQRFPESKNAPSAHWRAAWYSYRQGLYPEAIRLFDEQIRLYPTAPESVSALYWRGRLYETVDRQPAAAAADYRTIIRANQHFFYAQMARQRLAALNGVSGAVTPAFQQQLDRFQPPVVPVLQQSFPVDSPHLAKARLLANAGLNEYIPQEIAADPDSSSWSALAEAQIYASYGENYRAMRALKRGLPYAASASIHSIPLVYWRILFPEPWWDTIKTESAKNGLDPYLVLSLMRQESEFDPSVISYANAYGLMQLLPITGKVLAREEGMSNFQPFQLLNPEINIELGTRYLKQMMDKFGGVQVYALAAYNAGDNRVTDWEAAGPYSGIDEFVESIPFTQTRDYVQAILRNEETYRAIDEAAAQARGASR